MSKYEKKDIEMTLGRRRSELSLKGQLNSEHTKRLEVEERA